MAAKKNSSIPQFHQLLLPTFLALKKLGGSGSNDEILDTVIEYLKLPDEAVDLPHLGSTTQTELQYRLAWARTYLKKAGVIENSARSVWSITPAYSDKETLTDNDIAHIRQRTPSSSAKKDLRKSNSTILHGKSSTS